ncbi:MAG: cation:proton antiporter [bacterium]
MHLLLDVILLLTVATVGVLAGRAARIPPVVAYLIGGVLVGPGGLRFVAQSEDVAHLAELGVALLLFGVGIEFSLDRLRRILARMLASGALQVCLTVAATALVFRALDVAWPRAVFVGFLVALSSTAIVFKLYAESGELDAPQGLAAAAILLFQDLALVPMMLLVPMLAGGDAGTVSVLRALGSAALAVAILLFLSRTVLPRFLSLLARARTPELFPLAALVVAFGTALGARALGLSLPIGAFLAGLALSGSPYAHQVFAELVPLRDAFVAVFFTSIGMLFEPATLLAHPAALLGMVGLVLFKGLLIVGVVQLLWRSTRLAVLTGAALSQIGEFSFVLAREGVSRGLIAPDLEQTFLGAAILTMAGTPFLLRGARRLSRTGEETPAAADAVVPEEQVLLVGYGTTGRAIARVLRQTGLPFEIVDILPEAVKEGQDEGIPVRFGDATRRATLETLGAERARAIVVAVADPQATRRIVSLVRQMNSTGRILARARRVDEIPELERLGADEVLPADFEISIELLVRLLVHLGVPRHVVRVQESLIRLDHYQALRGTGRAPELLAEAKKIVMGGILETAQVMRGSAAAGRTLAELDLRRTTGAAVLTVVRDGQPEPMPGGSTRLVEGDLLVLYGPHVAIDRALGLFEPTET